MKNRKRTHIRIFAALLSSVLLLAGCRGDAGNADVGNADIGNAGVGNTGVEEQQAPASDASQDGSDQAPDKNGTKAAGPELAEEACEAFERFLKDQEPLYFDKCNLDGAWDPDTEDFEKRFRENTPYRFEELLEAFAAYHEMFEDDSFEMGRVEYAYIDCGADSVPELAVRIADYETYMGSYSEVYIIKLIDHRLKLCHSYEYGYRTYARINEYGYLSDEGSTGAASYSCTEGFINGDGEYVFVYEVSTEFTQYSEQRDDYEAEWESYAFKPFSAYYIYGDDSYQKYVDDQIWTYWMLDENGHRIEDEILYSDLAYPGIPETGYVSHAEAAELLRRQKETVGLTEKIENGEEPEWTILIPAPERKIRPVTVTNPGWDYYCAPGLTEAAEHIRLEKLSQESNDIINAGDWFAAIGREMPDREYQSDGNYRYHLYGEDSFGFSPYRLEINDAGGKKIAELDFSEFYTPDQYVQGDFLFVSEEIHSPRIADGILYLGVFHNTYASSAPHNGYIMAIDMEDDYRVLWKSEPLTCNADNFEIVDDTIICGYGFTKEDDFIYLLDKNTGRRIDTIKVRTGPDYFYAVEDKLYVRTYDTDYVFQIKR